MANRQDDARSEPARQTTSASATEEPFDPFDLPDSAESALLGALANYLSASHDKDDIRRAINVWSHDAINAGLQPEQLLVVFKNILVQLTPRQRSIGYERWLAARREMIVMCIEEYWRK
jgi:hypothetical protein